LSLINILTIFVPTAEVQNIKGKFEEEKVTFSLQHRTVGLVFVFHSNLIILFRSSGSKPKNPDGVQRDEDPVTTTLSGNLSLEIQIRVMSHSIVNLLFLDCYLL